MRLKELRTVDKPAGCMRNEHVEVSRLSKPIMQFTFRPHQEVAPALPTIAAAILSPPVGVG